MNWNSVDMKLYLVGTQASFVTMSLAVNSLVGLSQPTRGVVGGGPDCLPVTYFPGAPGWTETYFSGTIDALDGSVSAVPVIDEMFAFEGMSAVVSGTIINLPRLSDAVAEEQLPQILKDVLISLSSSL
jgi:hypothetical protein